MTLSNLESDFLELAESSGVIFNADRDRWLVILQKLYAVKRQLLRAIRLYTEDCDYICALTLSGAAYSLIREMLRVEFQDDIGNHALLVNAFSRLAGRDQHTKADVIRSELKPVNWLKHYKSSDSQVPEIRDFDIEDRAEFMIDNVVSAYIKFIKLFTPEFVSEERDSCFGSVEIDQWYERFELKELPFD